MVAVNLIGDLPRADWSIGTAPKYSVTVHWNGTPLPDGVNDEDVIWGDANYHISKDWSPEPGIQGGDGIMYHRLYGRDGTVYLTRDPSDILWHCGDTFGNWHSEAWQVMVGAGETCTPEQLAALKRDLQAEERPLFPHRHWSPTQCPGDELVGVLANLTEEDVTEDRVKQLIQEAVATTIQAIKDELAKQAHHTHETGEPVHK